MQDQSLSSSFTLTARLPKIFRFELPGIARQFTFSKELEMNKTIHRLMKFLLVFALTVGSSYSVQALSATANLNSDPYVSPQGSDSNSCTLSAPCETFDRAMSLAQLGDTVHILAGTYHQQLVISKSDINVVGEGAVIDGANMGKNLCVQVTGNNVILDGVTVKNCQSHGISVFGDNVTVQNSTVTNSVLENYPPGSMNSGWGSAFKSAQGSSNVRFLNNLAYENFGEGFGITKTIGATLSGNVAIDNYSVNFYPDNSSNVVLAENFSACSGNPLFNRNGKKPNGIALGEEYYAGWTTHPHNILITQNIVSGCERGLNYWGSDVSGGGLVDVTIQNNTFYGNGKTLSIAYDAANQNVVLQYNIFESAPSSWVENSSGITFQNNFWIGSLPTNNTLGMNDIAGTPGFSVNPVWNDADTFRLNAGSLACGYGRWDCDSSPATSTPDEPTETPPTALPTATPTVTETPLPPSPTPTVTESPAALTPTPPAVVTKDAPAAETVYDDTDNAFVYDKKWVNANHKKAYGGSFKRTGKDGASATLEFTGQSFSVIYRTGSAFRTIEVYVDGQFVGNIDQQTEKNYFQQNWDYPGQLPYGTHTLKLVFKANLSDTKTRGSLDAVIIR